MSEFGQRAFQFYLSRGYAPHQAAALAGNAMAESSGRAGAVGDRGKALGLFQWHPDRQQLLRSFAQREGLDPMSETTQLAYKDWELRNNERGAGDRLRAARTPQEANDAVLRSLRPSGFSRADPTGSMHYDRRLANTLALAGDQAMYSPPFDPRMMRQAGAMNGGPMSIAPPGQSPFGTLRPPMGPSFMNASPPMPGGAPNMQPPYAPSTPFRDPSMDTMQVGENTANPTPAGEMDWAKLAGGLKSLAGAAGGQPQQQPNIPVPDAPMNRPQVQGLPQLNSNQLLMALARSRLGGNARQAMQNTPLAGLLGGM